MTNWCKLTVDQQSLLRNGFLDHLQSVRLGCELRRFPGYCLVARTWKKKDYAVDDRRHNCLLLRSRFAEHSLEL